ncbi:Gfo/Idh/MocA family protein [Paenibacillus spongiae]|uniref:Gfo/Idh/MocA family oxidoreductase n=1 Tax=Paenibacillus spongiae TaxID=2909671 RepID=A0ABY5SFV6_9BACL|nr:Gfo/Idh/MocA family oxidoreductase [Paenibacillus spongiae]UVI32861.1 Gfo/Idh/MocA family oxidoreductase [Paenibacillus spongiae]
MTKRMRFIQIGTGGFGSYWCSAVLPYIVKELGIAEAVAAVDVNPEAHRSIIDSLGLPPDKCYTDVHRAFAENAADFAIVVVPPAYHEQMVDIALAHDCHILSEKPISDSMESSCRIYKKVKQAGKKMAVTMSHRFDQDKQTLEGLLRSKTYGELNYIVSRFTCECRQYPAWGAFRYGIADPLLIEGTVHHFDILRSLSGSNAKTVYAKTWNPGWSDFSGDSTGFITIEMENGVNAFYEGAKANATTLNGWTEEYFRAECENATLELNRREITVRSHLGYPHAENATISMKKQRAWKNPWLAEMFVNWINEGEAPPNNLDDNLQCTALLFAAIESAHTGQVVDVQSYLRKHLNGD